MKLKLSFLSIILCVILMFTQGLTSSESKDDKTIKIGAILNLDSRFGKEQKIAIQIAVENFNNPNFKISIRVIPYKQSLLQIAIEAETLIKEKKVEVIIVGIENWQATSLVAQIGALAQVPIFSLTASSPITSSFPSLQWPFLVQMSHNAIQQVQDIASIIKYYNWRKIIVVYEDDIDSNCGIISLLTQALQSIGVKIENHLVLPPFSSTVNTTGAVKEEMKRFMEERCYSRVFVVLSISSPFVRPLFEEAKETGLMRNDSVWITMGTISDLIPSFDTSILSNMEGVIGIMTKFDNSTIDYQVFEAKFGNKFLEKYAKETYYAPSHQALLAYDAIDIIKRAKLSLINTRDYVAKPRSFLDEILLSNFAGLSGQVLFNQEDNKLAKNASTKLVNVVSASYYDDLLDFTKASEVKWPSKVKGARPPKGWLMPTYKKPMRIGVPIAHNFKNFVDYQGTTLGSKDCFPSKGDASMLLINNKDFNGYCIAVFLEVVQLLERSYELPYELVPFNCSYDDLVNDVHNKNFHAAVGDMTILANRTDIVDFTQPFEESGLSIVLPVKRYYNSHGPWIFLKPFTSNMWIVSFFVFLFTMIIIWILEHEDNKAFQGPVVNQLSTTAWFGFNSFYFTHREKISSKLARVVVILWLFIVLILSQSYTANLTSMITNDRLNQTTIDVEMLRRTNAKVGYDNASFVNLFLEDLLKFNPNNTIGVEGKFEDFHKGFEAGTISAFCLEYPYAKLFVSQYCNQYIMTQPIHRFGGFGFVFPKGSPIALDVSEAILTLIENGKLKKLEKKYLNISSECTIITDDTYKNNDGHQSSLSLESFKILFYMSGATSTICFLASLVPLYLNRRRRMRNLRARNT